MPNAWTEPERGRLRTLVRDLALAIRAAVVPHLGAHAARAHTGDPAAGGDVTFDIDSVAERALAEYIERAGSDVVYYSEHQGLVASRVAAASSDGGAAGVPVLVVDPVDGTRPALAGLESCCVSVAAAPLRDGVTMAELEIGCVVEIPSGAVFLAERGRGLVESPPVTLSATDTIERMFWAYGFRGRPARPTAEALAELIDRSSVGGAAFELGSAAYDMTRILTGQLDAYVEPGPLLVGEVPGLGAEFARVGGGAILNNAPYDLAGAWLCLVEGGAVVTDARGKPLDDRPLVGSGADYQMSVVAAAGPRLHADVVAVIERGLERLRASAPAGLPRAALG